MGLAPAPPFMSTRRSLLVKLELQYEGKGPQMQFGVCPYSSRWMLGHREIGPCEGGQYFIRLPERRVNLLKPSHLRGAQGRAPTPLLQHSS